MTDQPRRGNER